jgi:hypothetical protein
VRVIHAVVREVCPRFCQRTLRIHRRQVHRRSHLQRRVNDRQRRVLPVSVFPTPPPQRPRRHWDPVALCLVDDSRDKATEHSVHFNASEQIIYHRLNTRCLPPQSLRLGRFQRHSCSSGGGGGRCRCSFFLLRLTPSLLSVVHRLDQSVSFALDSFLHFGQKPAGIRCKCFRLF